MGYFIVYQMLPGTSFRLVDTVLLGVNGLEIKAQRETNVYVFKVTQLVNAGNINLSCL